MAVIPETFTDLLESTALIHMATIGPNGEPQNTPVWFGWDGTHILVSQTTNRQKYRNLLRDPHVALSIVDLANPYRHLEIRGKVTRIDPDPDYTFVNSMAKKYLDKDVYPWHNPGDQRVIFVIEPERVTHN